MKKTKYIITSGGIMNWQEGKPFCSGCGNRNKVHPIGDYDPDTGTPTAWYICTNTKCTYGKSYECNHVSGHDFKKKWIFGASICTRCGLHDSNPAFI